MIGKDLRRTMESHSGRTEGCEHGSCSMTRHSEPGLEAEPGHRGSQSPGPQPRWIPEVSVLGVSAPRVLCASPHIREGLLLSRRPRGRTGLLRVLHVRLPGTPPHALLTLAGFVPYPLAVIT